MRIEYENLQVGIIVADEKLPEFFLRHPDTGGMCRVVIPHRLAWSLSSDMGVPFTVPIGEDA